MPKNEKVIKLNEVVGLLNIRSNLCQVVENHVGAFYSRKFYGYKDCPYCSGLGWVIKDKEKI